MMGMTIARTMSRLVIRVKMRQLLELVLEEAIVVGGWGVVAVCMCVEVLRWRRDEEEEGACMYISSHFVWAW